MSYCRVHLLNRNRFSSGLVQLAKDVIDILRNGSYEDVSVLRNNEFKLVASVQA